MEINDIHEHHGVAFTLMVLGGIFDAYAYLLLDGSFASMQTGNAVFLIFSLARGEWAMIPRYILPLISFSLGIFVSRHIRIKGVSLPGSRRIGAVLLCEGMLLTLIGIGGEGMNHRIIAVLIAFLAALQVSTFDRVRGASYASTMITGNLRLAMENLHGRLMTGDREGGERARIYGMLILFFSLGVFLGAEGVRLAGIRSILICLPLLGGIYLYIRISSGAG
ncbi:MAG: DUF1275 domain-containing protein [Spirochaetales bacterium]|nr:DUF1275 domain-containing protein [Spirochaetales bacterium]